MTDTDESVRRQSVVETVKTLLTDIQHVDTILPGCEPGNNYMSLVYRILVRFKQLPDLQWLFVKVRAKGDEITEWADFNVAFSNECKGYKYLEDFELPLSKCYLAQEEIIILKDLVSEGYTMVDKYQGYNLVQAEVLLETLAKFHGNSIRLRSDNISVFETLSSKFQNLMIDFDKIPEDYFEATLKNIGELDYDMSKRLDGYRNGKNFDLVTQFLTINKRNEKHDLLGIIHGDFWINNIMLRVKGDSKQHEEGKASLFDVKVVDLQSIDVNSVLVDLITFLITSIHLPVLLDHYSHLIQHYHQHLNLPKISLDLLHSEIELYKPFILPVFMWRALPTRSSTKEQYEENFRLFAQFIRKYGII